MTRRRGQKFAVILWLAFKQNTKSVMIVKHGQCPRSSRSSLTPSPGRRQPMLLVILRRTQRPIPARPLKAHSIKRVAFIPSIFTRDVSSSVAGFLAIRVTGSALYIEPSLILRPPRLSVKSEVRVSSITCRCLYIQLRAPRYCFLRNGRIKY